MNEAMVVLENVCGFFLAWDSGVWVASHDVQKIFDPIEHVSLFQTRTCKCFPGYTRIPLEMLAVTVFFVTSHVG